MKITTPLLITALVCLPMHRQRAQIAPAMFAITVTATLGAAGTYIWIRCKNSQRYWCIQKQADGERSCIVTSPREIRLQEWTVRGGPFVDPTMCASACDKTNQTATSFGPDESYERILHVERSFDLVNWSEIATLDADPYDFEYSRFIPDGSRTQFFRVWY